MAVGHWKQSVSCRNGKTKYRRNRVWWKCTSWSSVENPELVSMMSLSIMSPLQYTVLPHIVPKTPRGQVLSKEAPNEGKHFHCRLLQMHPVPCSNLDASVTRGLIQVKTSMFHSRIFPSVLCPPLHTGLLMSPWHVSWLGPGSCKTALHVNFTCSLYSFQHAKSSQFPKI